MNKVILSGRLTKDVELKYTPNGVAVATLTLAVNRKVKKEGQPEADFINCVLWQKAAENAANMIGKGCRVNIVGRWESRNFDGQDGKKVYVNECVVDEINFIDFASDRGANNINNNQGNTNTPPAQQTPYGGQQAPNAGHDPFGNTGQIDISDDDLPF